MTEPAAVPTRRKKASGPAPSRIVAAAASVSAGIGLVALMASGQQDVVVQVNPPPIVVQPANVVVELQPATGQVRIAEPAPTVEAATPAEQPAPRARVVAQSAGS